MTIRIREGQVVEILLDTWYKVKLGSLLLDDIDFTSQPAQSDNPEVPTEGFIFTLADQENIMIAGPFSSIGAVRMVKE